MRAFRVTVIWAHPRAGGENRGDLTEHEITAGSSPRGRGKQVVTRADENIRRLIPARAGKTAVRPKTR